MNKKDVILNSLTSPSSCEVHIRAFVPYQFNCTYLYTYMQQGRRKLCLGTVENKRLW